MYNDIVVKNMVLKLRRKLSHSGRSLVLRIPRDVERMLNLSGGTNVNIWIENKHIIVEPLEMN
jgi:antitoxin component of MazEF toxin-antitoxin module